MVIYDDYYYPTQPKGTCPHCGYCPTCGRRNDYWRQPYYPYWWTNTGDNTVSWTTSGGTADEPCTNH